MKIFFTLLFLCGISSAFSQVYTSSCTATAQMIGLYKYDVVKTATVRLFKTNSTYKDSAAIPVLVKDSIAKAFYAVHNMPASSLRDTIRNLFSFTNFNTSYGPYYSEFDSVHIYQNDYSLGNFSPRRINLYVRDTSAWAIQWQAGNYSNTVNPAINQLVLQNGLIITGGGTFNSYINFVCTSNLGINMFGLSKSFNIIINPQPGYGALPFNYGGSGNSIETSYEATGIKVTYSNHCGDCPSGCYTGRSWTFFVSNADCSVQYLGATNLGPPLSITPPYIYTCTRGPVLPITFGTITGYLQSGKAALSWKVLTQINVKEYVVERSDDGQQFYTAGTVAATHALTADYTWKDVELLTGTAWYRIKAVDVDGKSKYSSIVKISGTVKGNLITIYPNPVKNRVFTIQFGTSIAGQIKADLYNIAGKKIWTSTFHLAPQMVGRTTDLPATVLPGIYMLVVESNGEKNQQKLVVQD